MQEKGEFILFYYYFLRYCVFVVLFVHTMLSRFGSQVFFRQGQKQIITSVIIISNITRCRITLQLQTQEINSHRS